MTCLPKLSRRAALKGAGATLALPWLEAMGNPSKSKPPVRFCGILFPYGIAIPKEDTPEREWGWFPTGKGKEYQLTNPLKPLENLKEHFSIFGGLSHPKCRSMNGHDTGDTWLTGNKLSNITYRNTISLDQFIAKHIGLQTRHASLTTSTDGGIGPRTRSTTLSYTEKGQPVPALSNPRQIFNHLFAADQAGKATQARLQNSASILDLTLEQANSLHRQLGKADQAKLDEFQTSVRQVEKRIENANRWLSIPLPEVDASLLKLDADPKDADDYLSVSFDLLYLALSTDLTRTVAHQLGSYGPTLARTFPAAAGLPSDWHKLAHAADKPGGAEQLGKFDQYLAGHLANFLQRLKDTPVSPDGETLLDRTLVLYGSSNSRTHNNTNYPLLLAGGNKLGLRHDHFLQYGQNVPMSNLFLTMLKAMGIEAESFAGSTGTLGELLA